ALNTDRELLGVGSYVLRIQKSCPGLEEVDASQSGTAERRKLCLNDWRLGSKQVQEILARELGRNRREVDRRTPSNVDQVEGSKRAGQCRKSGHEVHVGLEEISRHLDSAIPQRSDVRSFLQSRHEKGGVIVHARSAADDGLAVHRPVKPYRGSDVVLVLTRGFQLSEQRLQNSWLRQVVVEEVGLKEIGSTIVDCQVRAHLPRVLPVEPKTVALPSLLLIERRRLRRVADADKRDCDRELKDIIDSYLRSW